MWNVSASPEMKSNRALQENAGVMTTGDRAAPGLFDRALDRLNAVLGWFIEPDRNDDEPDRPVTTWRRLDTAIDGLLYVLSSALLIAITGAIIYSVFTRYALNRPPLWSEEVPMTFFMWMTFVGLALATRRGENIRVTYFIEKLSPRQRLVLELFMHLLVIATMIVILWFSFRIIRLQMRGTMLSTGWSRAVNWFPLPLGMALSALYQVKLVRRSVRQYERGMRALRG